MAAADWAPGRRVPVRALYCPSELHSAACRAFRLESCTFSGMDDECQWVKFDTADEFQDQMSYLVTMEEDRERRLRYQEMTKETERRVCFGDISVPPGSGSGGAERYLMCLVLHPEGSRAAGGRAPPQSPPRGGGGEGEESDLALDDGGSHHDPAQSASSPAASSPAAALQSHRKREAGPRKRPRKRSDKAAGRQVIDSLPQLLRPGEHDPRPRCRLVAGPAETILAAPGAQLVLHWEVSNAGPQAWPEGVKVERKPPDQPRERGLERDSPALDGLQPGARGAVRWQDRAPTEPGEHVYNCVLRVECMRFVMVGALRATVRVCPPQGQG
eukprot:TRINITY_DN7506_c0_g1_i1.p1 TRINITY_DN7506_c0_g1~~TRINITY_DN7506_c0_g1_i1.p1  ORF type:complete len:352 (+),score=69.28 TRINITY_DN7506_c0_g1_i1:71-1057(+)